jgi:Ceramidase
MVAIQFCEPVYQYSPHIAEFWNTVSSLAFCLVGCLYLRELSALIKQTPAAFANGSALRFKVLGWSVIAVGVGSALLHGTQTWWGELIDEFSMLVAGLTFLFCQEDLHPLTSGSKRFWFYGVTVSASAIVTAVYLLIFVHGLFATLFAAIIGVSIAIFATSPVHNALAAAKFRLRVGKRLAASVYGPRFVLGTALSGAAFVAWLVDQSCVRLAWGGTALGWVYVFHSLWHICTALAAWTYLSLIIKVRADVISADPFARSRSGSFVPDNGTHTD